MFGTSGQGWLSRLLTRSGVTSSTARSIVDLVVRPLEIVLVVALAALAGHYGSRAIRRILGGIGQQAAARSGDGRTRARVTTVVALLANIWRFVVVVIAVSVVLGILGINLTPLLASATVIGATIGFGAQSLVRDYLSGILLTMEDQYGIGDEITVGTTTGVVEDVSLRVTRLRSAEGLILYVPNGDIREVANASRGWAKASVDVPMERPADGSLEPVREAAAAAARSVAQSPRFAASCVEPPEIVGMVAADAGTYTLRVALRTTPVLRDAVERALREAVVAALDTLARTSPPPPDEGSEAPPPAPRH